MTRTETPTVPPPHPSDHPLDPVGEQGRLAGWLEARGFALSRVEALPGDVSKRRYYRVHLAGRGSAVLATYPSDQVRVCERFRTTTRLLTEAGVRVPEVLAAECHGGLCLVEDLGEQTLHEWSENRSWDEVLPYYLSVLEPMARVAALPTGSVRDLSRPLDLELLEWELDKTWTTYLEPQGLAGPPETERRFRQALSELCRAVAAVPPVPCHRDLTPRNLVPLPDGATAILDHQDLRLGPPLYDLASLLNDTLFPPPDVEQEMMEGWGMSLARRLDYHRVAAQRTLKAVGSYAGAALQGNDRRLELIPSTLRRALDHLRGAPETHGLVDELGLLWQRVFEEGPVLEGTELATRARRGALLQSRES
ncbi:MAG TPA: phosphotransferase [Thermoanaerobaculia bacterium]|nr:phosphotransferase [Thermoanaerobaculia bacterium]